MIDNKNVNGFIESMEDDGMPPTIKNIAKMARVSTATVSRYLNNPSIVSESTGARIHDSIQKSGYIPNELARGLTKESSKIIGVIMPDINNIFFPSVLLGIEDELDRNGYYTFICNTHGDINKEKHYINTMTSLKIAGVIFMGTRPVKKRDNLHIFDLAKIKPVLLINDCFERHEISYIMTNESQGVIDAVRYLYSLNHRRIALLNGHLDYTTYVYKKAGFIEGCRQLGLDNEQYVLSVNPYETGGYDAMSELLKIDVANRPTAIITVNDQLAIGAVRSVFENGYNVPKDFSIIGFSNTPISKEIYPKLTTVDQFPYETGKKAAKMIVDQINSKNTERKKNVMKTKLVIRDSCALRVED
jgi:DNA-binding LacI/PurR family transcriptional regulator